MQIEIGDSLMNFLCLFEHLLNGFQKIVSVPCRTWTWTKDFRIVLSMLHILIQLTKKKQKENIQHLNLLIWSYRMTHILITWKEETNYSMNFTEITPSMCCSLIAWESIVSPSLLEYQFMFTFLTLSFDWKVFFPSPSLLLNRRVSKIGKRSNQRIEDLGRRIHLISTIRRMKHTLHYMWAILLFSLLFWHFTTLVVVCHHHNVTCFNLATLKGLIWD